MIFCLSWVFQILTNLVTVLIPVFFFFFFYIREAQYYFLGPTGGRDNKRDGTMTLQTTNDAIEWDCNRFLASGTNQLNPYLFPKTAEVPEGGFVEIIQCDTTTIRVKWKGFKDGWRPFVVASTSQGWKYAVADVWYSHTTSSGTLDDAQTFVRWQPDTNRPMRDVKNDRPVTVTTISGTAMTTEIQTNSGAQTDTVIVELPFTPSSVLSSELASSSATQSISSAESRRASSERISSSAPTIQCFW